VINSAPPLEIPVISSTAIVRPKIETVEDTFFGVELLEKKIRLTEGMIPQPVIYGRGHARPFRKAGQRPRFPRRCTSNDRFERRDERARAAGKNVGCSNVLSIRRDDLWRHTFRFA
jgi:hypothetical protein